jgi:hypothetical protein
MIAKGFAPISGIKFFAIMKVSPAMRGWWDYWGGWDYWR